jgi:hypothetical protein
VRHRLVCAVIIAAVLWVTTRACTDPWFGVTPAEFERLEERRLLGLALLENQEHAKAAEQFAALRAMRPSLALGYVNETVARYRLPGQQAYAVQAAREGVRRLPRAAQPRLVLAATLQASGCDLKPAAGSKSSVP